MARHDARSWRRLAFICLGMALGLVARPKQGSALVTAPDTPRTLLHETGPGTHGEHDFGFEARDTRVSTLVKVMVTAVAIIALSIAGLFVIIGRLTRADGSHPPLTRQQTATIVPPGPNLQDDPFRDIAHERKREETLLTTYGYIDPAHTRARIPIDRAIALVIGKKLDPGP